MIVEANLQGDVCMLEWLKQNLLAHYSGDESRVRTRFLRVARDYSYIDADSLRWYIDNISKEESSYTRSHRRSVIETLDKL